LFYQSGKKREKERKKEKERGEKERDIEEGRTR